MKKCYDLVIDGQVRGTMSIEINEFGFGIQIVGDVQAREIEERLDVPRRTLRQQIAERLLEQ